MNALGFAGYLVSLTALNGTLIEGKQPKIFCLQYVNTGGWSHSNEALFTKIGSELDLARWP